MRKLWFLKTMDISSMHLRVKIPLTPYLFEMDDGMAIFASLGFLELPNLEEENVFSSVHG